MRSHPQFVAALVLMLVLPAIAQTPSPYAGEQKRAIKALSPEETSDYLAGKGMGLAKAAELNGYPGPMHVLELAEQLELTAEQRARTQALFERMRAQAIPAGQALVEAERALDELFRSKRASPAAVTRELDRIAQRQAEVRRSHLDAHLAQVDILNPEQVRRYNEFRGYADADGKASPGHHRRH